MRNAEFGMRNEEFRVACKARSGLYIVFYATSCRERRLGVPGKRKLAM